MKNKILRAAKIALDALYPPVCAICAKPLGAYSLNPDNPGAHPECMSLTLPATNSVCCKCGKPTEDGEIYCRDCEEGSHTFTQALAAFEINSELKDALYRFKYKDKREYASFFAKSIFSAHKITLQLWQPELIIPIPMYYKKERLRGYNQAALIACELGKCVNIPVETDLLVRTKKTAPLKDCDASERKKLLRGAFKLNKKPEVKRILVVDDIYTTGASLDECALVLKEGGVHEVYGANVCTGAGV